MSTPANPRTVNKHLSQKMTNCDKKARLNAYL